MRMPMPMLMSMPMTRFLNGRSYLSGIIKRQKKPPEVLYKKGVLRKFPKSTGKHFKKLHAIKNKFFAEHLQTTAFEKISRKQPFYT